MAKGGASRPPVVGPWCTMEGGLLGVIYEQVCAVGTAVYI
jgi:hypothetical protein